MSDQPDNGCRYKRPESVLVLVYTGEGEVLLLRRVEPPDFWQSVTGSLRAGETPQSAATRELAEETGIAASPRATGIFRDFKVIPAWSARFPPGTTHNREYEFLLELGDRVPVSLNPREHSEFAWVKWSQAWRRVSSWTNREALERVFEQT